MKGKYGYFGTLDDFWSAFYSDAKLAQGFYTEDGADETGLRGFQEFVRFFSNKKKGKSKKCVWFEPQRAWLA